MKKTIKKPEFDEWSHWYNFDEIFEYLGIPDPSGNSTSTQGEIEINGLKGHRSVGGFRASMYNALPLESVQVLVDVMKELERTA